MHMCDQWYENLPKHNFFLPHTKSAVHTQIDTTSRNSSEFWAIRTQLPAPRETALIMTG